ncbi:protein disulfide-isomerase precursor [Podila epigama]|nr:protein disulfide-isomerase precursor [Podila epigama]
MAPSLVSLPPLFSPVAESDVLNLNQRTFDETIKNENLILLKGTKISLAQVDCTEKTTLCQEQGVQGYPTLKVFKNGDSEDYRGPRDAEGIVSYLRRHSQPALRTLSAENAAHFSTKDPIVVLGVLPADSEKREILARVAESLREDFTFGVVEESADIKAPGIVLYSGFGEDKNVLEGDFTAESLTEFITSNSVPQNNNGLVKVVVSNNYKEIVENLKKDVLIVFYTPWCVPCKTVLAIFERLGKSYKGSDIVFAKFDIDESEVPESVPFHIEAVPAVKLRKAGYSAKPSELHIVENLDKGCFDRVLRPPWSVLCKKLAPIYEDVGTLYQGSDIVIGKFNATTDHLPVNVPFLVEDYPTIKFRKTGSTKYIAYKGELTKEGIISFLRSKHFPTDFSRQGRHVRALVEVTTHQANELLERMREHCLHLEFVQLSCHSFYEDHFEMFFLGIQNTPPVTVQRTATVTRPRITTTILTTTSTAIANSTATTTTTTTTASASTTTAAADIKTPKAPSILPKPTNLRSNIKKQSTSPQPLLTPISPITTIAANTATATGVTTSSTTVAVVEKDLVRAKLCPEALNLIARAAGRAAPKQKQPKKPHEENIIQRDNPQSLDHPSSTQSSNSTHAHSVLDHSGHCRRRDRIAVPRLPPVAAGTIPECRPNGFLSDSIHTLILQVHHETILAILLWLTRAGLQGRLQGLRRFEIKGHDSMSVMTSKGQRFVPLTASAPTTTSTAAAAASTNMIHAGVLRDFWAVFPGLESCSIRSVLITDDQTPVSSKDNYAANGNNLLINNSRSPFILPCKVQVPHATTMMTTEDAYRIKRGQIARSGHHPGYLSEVVSTLAVIHRLIASDPSLGISSLTKLQLAEWDSLSSFQTLFTTLPYLTHLTLRKCDGASLNALPTLCPRLVSFAYGAFLSSSTILTGFPGTARLNDILFAGNSTSHHRLMEPDVRWTPFFNAMASRLQEIVLMSANIMDADVKLLALVGSNTLRSLTVSTTNVSISWRAAKAVLEHCSVLENCSMTCCGPAMLLFRHDPEFELLYNHHQQQQQQQQQQQPEGQGDSEAGHRNEDTPWACHQTLKVLHLAGLHSCNEETNMRLFKKISTLPKMRELRITGTGITVVTLLGPQDDGAHAPHGVGSDSGEEGETTHILQAINGKQESQVLYPHLEKVELPYLTKKLGLKELFMLLKAIPRLRRLDIGGAYEIEALVWIEAKRPDLITDAMR